MKYKWVVKENKEISKEFLDIAFGSEVVAKLLLNRNIDSSEKAKSYLFPEFYKESKPEEIPDLEKAKNRIIQAIKNKEKITIYGDYDVDGVTSTSCLLIALRQFTDEIDYYIPSRLTEGYGLNNEAVKTIANDHKKTHRGASLLITCDCGITNHKEIELANSLGMDVIVTDHHSLPEILPPAVAVLNPKLLPENHKLHFLPGVGVAYKLAEAILEERTGEPANGRITKEDLLDLVTLGMIADLAPLVDENRYLVQIGLPKLAATKKVGLQELLKACVVNKNKTASTPNVEHIGFGIAPRINAVGRLTDAKLAVKLLTTDNLLEAVQIACELEAQNRERQSLCEETLKEAVILASEQIDFEKDKCIVLANENWHHGVIGIVASRLVEKFSLPTILIAIDKEQNIARGSGRSIEKLNIVEALVENSTHLEKFGGHKAACGLSIKPENLNYFISDFKNYVNDLLVNSDMGPILNIDLELPLVYLDFSLIEKIYKLSPYGLANPLPIFASDEVEIVGIRQIGKNGQHLKLNVTASRCNGVSANRTFEALIWNYNQKVQLKSGDRIKIAYTPKINFFNGENFIQLEVKDVENVTACRRIGVSARGQENVSANEEIKLFDYRGRTQDCINLFSSGQVLYFAETEQKNHLPLKTNSRGNIQNCKKLVLLECPPDEYILFDVIKRSDAKEIYFAFSNESFYTEPGEILKRLIGMLKFIKNNRSSIVNELELQSAIGLNKYSLAYALELLKHTGFLALEKKEGDLTIEIMTPDRQDFSDLIEYTLFVSELKQIQKFRGFLMREDILILEEMLKKNGVFVGRYMPRHVSTVEGYK